MPLTEQERVALRHHMAYMNVAQAYTFVLGVPAGVETQFLIEGAMDKVLDSALPQLRKLIAVLDGIEQQKIENLELLAVTKVGEIEIRQDEQEALDKQYDFWRGKVANLLGIIVNPWDKSQGRGINARVIG
jgi:hypothetical protein